MPSVSVIVPVYNAKDYIRSCVRDLQAQTLSDIEIILINDGSTDQGLEQVQDLIASDPRIKLINQENAGAAAARNAGLALAQGKYISFADSDDSFNPNWLKNLYEQCENEQLDLICGSFEALYRDGKRTRMARSPELLDSTTLDGPTLYKRQIQLRNYIPMIWAYMYRRDFLEANQLQLVPQTIHEDEQFTPRVWLAAKRAKIIEIYDYLYHRETENSIIQTRSADSVADLAQILESFLTEQQKLDSEKQAAFAYAILYILDHYVYYSRMTRKVNRQLVKSALSVLTEWKILTGYQRLKYTIITVSPKLYYHLQHYEN